MPDLITEKPILKPFYNEDRRNSYKKVFANIRAL
tara:strand:+ start:1074 stop:1175 length:102 start_codon:yes stop_codon:yes gene_type:complete